VITTVIVARHEQNYSICNLSSLAPFARLRDDWFVVSMPVIGGAKQKAAPEKLGEFHEDVQP
jgi:hypothetical protein